MSNRVNKADGGEKERLHGVRKGRGEKVRRKQFQYVQHMGQTNLTSLEKDVEEGKKGRH